MAPGRVDAHPLNNTTVSIITRRRAACRDRNVALGCNTSPFLSLALKGSKRTIASTNPTPLISVDTSRAG
ncbi:hypothetical protein AB1N83_013694 [Pleurotus pulmonarius]